MAAEIFSCEFNRYDKQQRPGRAQRHDRQPTCARVRARLEQVKAPEEMNPLST